MSTETKTFTMDPVKATEVAEQLTDALGHGGRAYVSIRPTKKYGREERHIFVEVKQSYFDGEQLRTVLEVAGEHDMTINSWCEDGLILVRLFPKKQR